MRILALALLAAPIAWSADDAALAPDPAFAFHRYDVRALKLTPDGIEGRLQPYRGAMASMRAKPDHCVSAPAGTLPAFQLPDKDLYGFEALLVPDGAVLTPATSSKETKEHREDGPKAHPPKADLWRSGCAVLRAPDGRPTRVYEKLREVSPNDQGPGDVTTTKEVVVDYDAKGRVNAAYTTWTLEATDFTSTGEALVVPYFEHGVRAGYVRFLVEDDTVSGKPKHAELASIRIGRE